MATLPSQRRQGVELRKAYLFTSALNMVSSGARLAGPFSTVLACLAQCETQDTPKCVVFSFRHNHRKDASSMANSLLLAEPRMACVNAMDPIYEAMERWRAVCWMTIIKKEK